jgi:hypothetical protein
MPKFDVKVYEDLTCVEYTPHNEVEALDKKDAAVKAAKSDFEIRSKMNEVAFDDTVITLIDVYGDGECDRFSVTRSATYLVGVGDPHAVV